MDIIYRKSIYLAGCQKEVETDSILKTNLRLIVGSVTLKFHQSKFISFWDKVYTRTLQTLYWQPYFIKALVVSEIIEFHKLGFFVHQIFLLENLVNKKNIPKKKVFSSFFGRFKYKWIRHFQWPHIFISFKSFFKISDQRNGVLGMT